MVTVTAAPNSGFKFRRWTGDLTGTFPSGVIDMSAPRSVVAQMDTVPYIAPAGISNAVGQTPSSAVAPGSLIFMLWPKPGTGRAGWSGEPALAEYCGSYRNGEQLDSAVDVRLAAADQRTTDVELNKRRVQLEVHNTGQPDITGNFTVARNALFFQTINSQQFATALHTDGSAVTAAKPAVAVETISLLGTGFGPYRETVLDGFYPPSPAPALADSVTLTVAAKRCFRSRRLPLRVIRRLLGSNSRYPRAYRPARQER